MIFLNKEKIGIKKTDRRFAHLGLFGLISFLLINDKRHILYALLLSVEDKITLQYEENS
jgi:hypothetical protein